MYSLGSIERRLVRDDAELGREFGDGYEWIDGDVFSRLSVISNSTATFRSGTQAK